jgi:hypothetical protein
VVSLSGTETAAADEETGTDGRRGRRSRRGGRRRGKGQESEGETVVVPTEAEEEEPLSLPVYTQAPIWEAPRLVPTIGEIGLESISLSIQARLDSETGLVRVNDQSFEPRMLFINAEASTDGVVVQDEIRSAAASGIHIHSSVVNLPLKNAYGERSFGPLDALVGQIIDSDPDGYILLRLQCVATNFWARTHPLEMARYSDGSEGDVSFASTDFWQDCVEGIAAVVRHLADPSTPGGDRVIGLHLDKGEWFYDSQSGYDYSAPNRHAFRNWLRAKYQTIYALRAAWYDNSVTFDNAEIPPNDASDSRKLDTALYITQKKRRWVDYNTFSSEVIAEAITGMADAIKALTDNRLLVAVSYGYTFEFAQRNDSGHQALGRVLASPSIDIVAGPNSYQNRSAGGPGAFASPVDSVRLHGKLYLLEDDTKTYLASEETEDAYNPRIATPQDTSSVHLRNASAALLHRCGVCWMDLWGRGWLNSDEIWDDLRQIGELFEIVSRFRQRSSSSAPEVAVLVDEASYAYVRSDPSTIGLQAGLITKARDLLCRSGASIGFYLQSDVGRLPADIKLYIFLNALQVTAEQRQAIRELLQRQGKTLAWLYGPGMFDEKGPSAQEISEIVGMPLKAQSWNSKVGTLFTEERHPIIERLHGGKRMGTEEVVNPSFSVIDPQAKVVGEYLQSGNPSIAAKNLENGWKSVFIGEPHLTGELIRGIYRYAGVHLYDVQDDVVYADNDGLLAIHAPYTGQRTIHLPHAAAVYSLSERRLVTQQSSTFRVFMRGRTSHFLLWGELDRISAATGVSIDDLKASLQSQRQEGSPDRSRENRPGGRRSPEDELELVLHQIDVEREGAESQGADSSPEDGLSVDRSAESFREAVLIAEAVTAGIGDEPVDLDEAAGREDGPLEPREPTTPSRRRRWQRRQGSGAQRPPTPPMSLEEIMPDLPPRRRPAEGQEESS